MHLSYPSKNSILFCASFLCSRTKICCWEANRRSPFAMQEAKLKTKVIQIIPALHFIRQNDDKRCYSDEPPSLTNTKHERRTSMSLLVTLFSAFSTFLSFFSFPYYSHVLSFPNALLAIKFFSTTTSTCTTTPFFTISPIMKHITYPFLRTSSVRTHP